MANNPSAVIGFPSVTTLPPANATPNVYAYAAGDAAAGDGGGGLYVSNGTNWINSPPGGTEYTRPTTPSIGAPAIVQTLSSVLDAMEVNPFDWMTGGEQTAVLNYTSAEDLIGPMQKAVNESLYGNVASQSVKMSSGLWNTTKALQFGYGTSFKTGAIRGDFCPYVYNGAQGTILNCSQVDQPGINIQGGRHMILENLLIKGPAQATIAAISFVGLDCTLEATWDNALIAAGVTPNLRYTPFAAITVDGYSGVAPAPPYPNVTYPAFLGAGIPQYGKSNTSQVMIDHVAVSGWEQALAVQPSNTDGNGDYIEWRHLFVSYCKNGISIGNGQSRNPVLEGIVLQVYEFMVNAKNGRQIGQFGGYLGPLDFNNTIRIFNFNSTAVTNPIELKCSGENIWQIGNLSGGGSNVNNFKIVKPDFNFRHSAVNGIPAYVLTGASEAGDIILQDGDLVGSATFQLQPPNARFDGTQINANIEVPNLPYAQIAYNAMQGGVMTLPSTEQVNKCRFVPYNVISGVKDSGSLIVNETYRKTGRRYLLPLNSIVSRELLGGIWYGKCTVRRPSWNTGLNPAAFTATSRADRTVTFTTASITTQAQANQQGFSPGDIIRDTITGTIMWIRSAVVNAGVSTTVIAEMLNNYYLNGAAYALIDTAFGFGAGSWTFIPCKMYTPTAPLQGTLTGASADITALLTPEATSYNGGIAVGDILSVRSYSTGLPFTVANSAVTVVDTGTPLITLTGNCAIPYVNLDLDFWMIPPPANSAVR